MTVSELIAELQKFDGDLEVQFMADVYGETPIDGVYESITRNPNDLRKTIPIVFLD